MKMVKIGSQNWQLFNIQRMAILRFWYEVGHNDLKNCAKTYKMEKNIKIQEYNGLTA